MKKYTDEELSRILSLAAVGLLGRVNTDYNDTFCLEQAAQGAWVTDYYTRGRWPNIDAWDCQGFAYTNPGPDDTLAWLEENGMA